MFTLIIMYCMLHILFCMFLRIELSKKGLSAGWYPYLNIIIFGIYLMTTIASYYTFYSFVGYLCISFVIHGFLIMFEYNSFLKNKDLL